MSKDKEILEASLRAFAVADRLDDIKNLLLAHPEVDVNAVDGNGNSALMLVASEKRDTSVAIAHFLMENGASTELKNNDGKDATDRAMDVYPNNEMFLKLQEPIKVIDRSVKRVLGERNFQSGKIPIRNRSLSDKSMDSDVTDRESVSTEGDEVSNVLNQLQRMTVEQLAQLREALPKEILAALSGEEAIEEKKKINRPNGPKKTHKALNLGGQHGSVQQVRVEEGRVAKPLEIDELQPQIKGNEVSSVLLPLSAEDREISDPQAIIDNNLIARSLQHQDMETASSMLAMLNKSKSKLEGIDEAFKDGMIELIRAIPKFRGEILEARGDAISDQGKLKDKYKNIRAKSLDDPAIQEITRRLTPIEGLPSQVNDDLIKRAIESLCVDEQAEMKAAADACEARKQDSDNSKVLISSIIEGITDSNADLSQYSITTDTAMELTAIAPEINIAIFQAIAANREKFKKSDVAKAVGPAKLAIPKKSLVDSPNPLSDRVESSIVEYRSAFAEAKLKNDLSAEEFAKVLSEIESRTYENDDIKSDAIGEAQNEHSKTDVQIAANETRIKKDKALDVAKNRIYMDLVPKAIKLHQLNDALAEDLNPKLINQYLEASLIYHLKRLDPKIQPDALTNAKKEFITLMNHPNNKVALQAKEIPVDLESATKAILGDLGIKEAMIFKTEAQKAADLVAGGLKQAKVGESLVGVPVFGKTPVLNIGQRS